ncbi:MAG: sigma-54 dependent transcriptional regulator [Myxococcota bacterium]
MIRPDTVNFHGLVTASPQMRALFKKIERVARSDAAVLVRGETGTGKELVARAIHALSPRKKGSFRAINCATLTPDLAVSELFGHTRGAFTGAVKARRGAFALADQGTLFLDEIAELPLDIQARLLRALQEQEFIPLGGSEPVQVDVRIISATHRALRREVEARRFREDLMYRVRVVPLFLPRLAERENDIEALTWHFIALLNAHPRSVRRIQRISPDAARLMRRYSWPGNVRELHNVIEFAFATGEGEVMGTDDLTPEIRGEPPPAYAPHETADPVRQEILQALKAADWRREAAAKRLGMSRSTLWRKMRELDITAP